MYKLTTFLQSLSIKLKYCLLNIKRKLTIKYIVCESFILSILILIRYLSKPFINSLFKLNNEFELIKCVSSSIILYIIICIIRIILRSCLTKNFCLKTLFYRFKFQFNFNNMLIALFSVICRELYTLDIPIFTIIKDIINESYFNCLNIRMDLTNDQRLDMQELGWNNRRNLILNTQWIGKDGEDIFRSIENWKKAIENNEEYLTERMDSIPNRIAKLRNDTIHLQISLNQLIANKQLISEQSVVTSPNWNTVPNLNELYNVSSTTDLRGCLNRWKQNVDLMEGNITMFSDARKIAIAIEAKRIGVNNLVLERYYKSSMDHPDVDDTKALRKSAIDPNTGLVKILW